MDILSLNKETLPESTGPSFISTKKETEPTLTRDDVVIAIMGITGAGKSTFISHFASNVPVGHGLAACTTDIRPYAARIGEQSCFLVDTPGFGDAHLSDVDVFRKIAQWFDHCHRERLHLAGIVYLHRISDPRLSGTFLQYLRMFKKLCGPQGLPHVVIATTMWSQVSTEDGVKREQELVSQENLWGGMISRGSTVMRVDQGKASAANIIAYILANHDLMFLDIQEEMADGKMLDETSAGREMVGDLERMRTMKETELGELQEEMIEAQKQNDSLLLEQIATARTDLQRSLDRNWEARGRLHFARGDLQKRIGMEFLEIRQELKEIERREMELRREMKLLKERDERREMERREMEVRREMKLKLLKEMHERREVDERREMERREMERKQMEMELQKEMDLRREWELELQKHHERGPGWGILSVLFGTPIAMLALLTRTKDDKEKDKGHAPPLSFAGDSNTEGHTEVPGFEPSITTQQRSSLLSSDHSDINQKDFGEGISSGDTQKIQNLLETCFDDVAKGKFGWLRELKDLGYLESEIAELVLNIEEDSPWIYFESKTVTDDSISTQYHQPDCVHTLTGELLDISAYDGNMPSTVATVNSEVWQSPRSESFKKSTTKGAGLSIPSSENSRHSWNTDEESDNVVIEELCGLAGVCPHTRELEKWVGQVSFSANKTEVFASVTYALNAETKTESASYDGNMVNERDESAMLESDRIMRNLLSVLGRFCSVVAKSQKNGVCCDSFTILRKTTHPQYPSMIELTRIKICLALDLLEELKKCLAEPLWKSDQMLLQRIVAVANMICVAFLGPSSVQDVDSLNFGMPIKYESTVDLCSLAVQLLTVGFASYAQAHVDAYHPFFLDTPIHGIYLFGTRDLQSGSPQVSVMLHRFTCMDDMLQKPVMVFSQSSDSAESSKNSAYDLLATAIDLIDTWGPGELIYSDVQMSSKQQKYLAAIWLGGGTIQASTDAENEEDVILHWVKEIPAIHTSARRLIWTLDAKMRIAGGVEVNKNCVVDLKRNWSFFAESLENLGTYPGYWDFTEFQAGLAISGQQFIGAQVQFNKTWTWHDGNTWKQNFLGLLTQELPFEELDRPWGLQVSFCTGVSRRVPLRVLLADVMPAVLNSPSPPEWSTLKHYGIIQAFEGDNLKHWLDSLYKLPDPDKLIGLVKRIVYYALLLLRDTGIDRTGKKFRIACLRDQDSGRSIKMCLEIPCEKGNLWTRILADSKDCATFAYMTSLCLESDENKCQSSNLWHCPSLGTAVCRYRAKGDQPAGQSSVWKLQDQALYWIGKPESGLQTRVRISSNCSSAKLYVSISTMSERTLSRLGTMRLISKLGHKRDYLREKQYDHWHSQGVLVFTDHQGSSNSGGSVSSR